MSALSSSPRAALAGAPSTSTPRPVVIGRAIAALAWAAALLVAISGHMPTSHTDLPVAAAALLASYPAIDAIASIIGAVSGAGRSRVLVLNAAISTAAVVALAVTAFGADAGSTLIAFGAWAAVSGAVLLTTAIQRARAGERRISLMISGGLSTIAGLGFIAMSNSHEAHIKNLAGYMALGAVLFIVSALRRGAEA